MSDLQKVREALSGGGMTFAELKGKTDLEEKKLRKALSNLNTRREIERSGRSDQDMIVLKGDQGQAPPRKKVKRRRKAKAKRTYKRLADRVAATPPSNRNGTLARHVRTTFAALESVIELDGVEPYVAAAFASHKEAIELLAAQG